MGGPSAVHGEGRAGDVGGSGGRKKQRERGDIFDRGEAARRLFLLKELTGRFVV